MVRYGSKTYIGSSRWCTRKHYGIFAIDLSGRMHIFSFVRRWLIMFSIVRPDFHWHGSTVCLAGWSKLQGTYVIYSYVHVRGKRWNKPSARIRNSLSCMLWIFNLTSSVLHARGAPKMHVSPRAQGVSTIGSQPHTPSVFFVSYINVVLSKNL